MGTHPKLLDAEFLKPLDSNELLILHDFQNSVIRTSLRIGLDAERA